MKNPFPYTSRMYNCYRVFIACQQIMSERDNEDPWISSVEIKQRLPLSHVIILRNLRILTSLEIIERKTIKPKTVSQPKNFFKIVKDETAFLELK